VVISVQASSVLDDTYQYPSYQSFFFFFFFLDEFEYSLFSSHLLLAMSFVQLARNNKRRKGMTMTKQRHVTT